MIFIYSKYSCICSIKKWLGGKRSIASRMRNRGGQRGHCLWCSGAYLQRWRLRVNELGLADRRPGNDLPFRGPSPLGRESKSNRLSVGGRTIKGLNDLDIN